METQTSPQSPRTLEVTGTLSQRERVGDSADPQACSPSLKDTLPPDPTSCRPAKPLSDLREMPAQETK